MQSSITQFFRIQSHCILCHIPHRGRYAVCSACEALFASLGPACRYCATPLHHKDILICGPCSLQKPILDQVITAYTFQEPLRTVLHEFRYHEGLYLTAFLGQLMLRALPKHYPSECLIPVPMHIKRLRERGFNQANLLGRYLARQLQRPIDLFSAQKVLHTPNQANLPQETRRKNLRNAFQSRPLPYQHVTLIDDLITTGSTAHELAKVLKKNGVKRVDLWCCARA